MYLFEGRVTERGRGETRVKDLLVYSPNTAREPGTPPVSPLWVAGAQVRELSFAPSPGTSVAVLDRKWSSRD